MLPPVHTAFAPPPSPHIVLVVQRARRRCQIQAKLPSLPKELGQTMADE